MKGIKLKIILIAVMIIPVPFSCVDVDSCLDLEVMPYYRIMGLAFESVELYFINPASQKPMPLKVSQEYDTFVYPCDSMMLSFIVPNTELHFHAQNNNLKNGFSFTQEAFACERPGYMGTLDMIEKIYIESKYNFDERHNAGYDLSDIVDIFAYTVDESSGGFWRLDDYNETAPHPAPKRFYILFRQNATMSDVQQFVVRYHLIREDGTSEIFTEETPKFNVKIRI